MLDMENKLYAYNWDYEDFKDEVNIKDIFDCDDQYVYFMRDGRSYKFDAEGNESEHVYDVVNRIPSQQTQDKVVKLINEIGDLVFHSACENIEDYEITQTINEKAYKLLQYLHTGTYNLTDTDIALIITSICEDIRDTFMHDMHM